MYATQLSLCVYHAELAYVFPLSIDMEELQKCAQMPLPKRAFREGRPSRNIVKRDVLENARTKNVAETRVLEGPAAPNIVKNAVSLLGPFRNARFGRVRRPQTP